jgi:hypothetical protein
MGDAIDSSTNSSTNTSRNGTLQGNATFNTAGRVGGCVLLDGTGDYVNCPKIDDTNGVSQLTVAFWLKTNGQGNDDAICAKVKDSDEFFIVHLGNSAVNGPDDLGVAIFNGTTDSYVYTDRDYIPDGVWVHVAVVYHGSNQTM